MCGYAEQVGGVRVNTIMNNYVNEKGGVCCLNSGEEKIEQKDKDGNYIGVLIRQDLWKAKVSIKEGKVEVTPTTSTTPTIVNRLETLPSTPEVPKTNPFASVKAPTPQEGPI